MKYKTIQSTPAYQISNANKITTTFQRDYLTLRRDNQYSLVNAPWSTTPIYYLYGKESLDNIPLFSQPLVGSYDGKSFILTDMRSISKASSEGLVIANHREFEFAHLKTATMALWLQEDLSKLRSEGTLAGKVFVEAIANNIRQTMSVGLEEINTLKAITAMYYSCLFIDEEDYSTTTVARDLIRYANFSSLKMEALIESVGYINSPQELVDEIIKNTDSYQLKRGLTVVLLLNAISRATFGATAKESLVIGCYYPPMWIALVASTIDNRSYSKSAIGQIVDRYKKSEDYQSMQSLVKSIKYLDN